VLLPEWFEAVKATPGPEPLLDDFSDSRRTRAVIGLRRCPEAAAAAFPLVPAVQG
jgi:hypothetical protein